MDKHQILEWYITAGVDEAAQESPVDYFSKQETVDSGQPKTTTEISPTPSPSTANRQPPTANSLHHSPAAAASSARTLADAATTLAELEAAIRAFDGCALKKTATKTVFCDGNPKASVMVIGEAPGAQEDVQGIPFCGASGQLLDRMLASIGLTRADNTYISNTVFWRPPGNRQPTPEETAICLPFVEKHIALIGPRLLVLSGGTATTTLLRKDASVTRLRGKIYEYSNPYLNTPIPTIVTFHPSYLLRSPAQKALAWQDMLQIQDFLAH